MTDPFAAIAATYDDWFETPLGAFVDCQELEALRTILAGDSPGDVIEIGAGTGHVSEFLARLGFRVTAVEPSAAMRANGQSATAGLGVEWCEGRAEHLPFDDGRFDGALFFAALEFVADPGAALPEAFRVVRPGGWIVVAYLNALSPWAASSRHEADRGIPPWNAATFFTRDDIEALAGSPPWKTAAAAWLGPFAAPPFEEADDAGQRAGNAPALEILLWRKPA